MGFVAGAVPLQSVRPDAFTLREAQGRIGAAIAAMEPFCAKRLRHRLAKRVRERLVLGQESDRR